MLIGFSMTFVFSGPLLGPREMLLSRARGAYNRMPDHFLSLLLYVEHTKTWKYGCLQFFQWFLCFRGLCWGLGKRYSQSFRASPDPFFSILCYLYRQMPENKDKNDWFSYFSLISGFSGEWPRPRENLIPRVSEPLQILFDLMVPSTDKSRKMNQKIIDFHIFCGFLDSRGVARA